MYQPKNIRGFAEIRVVSLIPGSRPGRAGADQGSSLHIRIISGERSRYRSSEINLDEISRRYGIEGGRWIKHLLRERELIQSAGLNPRRTHHNEVKEPKG
jgi:hypothetical protein